MTELSEDELDDIYYTASGSDETVSSTGLRAIDRAAARRVLDEVLSVAEDLEFNHDAGVLMLRKIREMREGLE